MKLLKRILFFATLFLLIEVSLVVAWNGLLRDYPREHIGSWILAEWLINYGGGFVRRGLSGEIIFWLANGNHLIDFIYVSAYAFFVSYCVIFLLIFFLSDSRKPNIAIPALLVPGGIFQMGLLLEFFTRKEILFLLLFGCLCLLYLFSLRVSGSWRQRFLKAMYGLAYIGSIALMFMHEAFLFMAYPFILLLLWVVRSENRSSLWFRWGCLFYALSIPLIFFFLGMHHGNREIADGIWQSLPLVDRVLIAPEAPYSVFGPIASIGWGMKQNFLTIYGVYATSGLLYWPIFILGNAVVLVYLALGVTLKDSQLALRVGCLVLFAVAISALMFLIAADWGRWIAFITNAALMLLFTLSRSEYANEIKVAEPKWAQYAYSNWTLMAILIYEVCLRMPECCINPQFLWMPLGGIFGFLR